MLEFKNPQREAEFREATKKDKLFVMEKTSVCPGCKTPRSPMQFDGKRHCRKCRGVK